ncbi:hypothetical protein J2T13_004388 [Paenibacillus sp. DS2015]|uniref:hypothetical protein n=1 Tax=Paenibacillus sp. DS2015 TaxID=3373917 RepID=UPI003D1EB773
MAVTSDLFKVQEPQKLAEPVGIVVLFSSFISAENYPVHLEEGKAFMKYISPFLCAVIHILIFIVHRIRKRFSFYR